MLLEVGPCQPEEMAAWSKFARRIVCELRSCPADCDRLPSTMLDCWATTIDEWARVANDSLARDRPFRWVSDIEPEMVEFLLNGLDRCVHSETFTGCCTPEDVATHLPMTKVVVQSFVDSLEAESNSCRHFADEVRASLVALLD